MIINKANETFSFPFIDRYFLFIYNCLFNDLQLIVGHIFFDNAFDPLKEGEKYADVNEYVKDLIDVMHKVGR